MLNNASGKQELDIVNMLIRALSDEMAEQRAHEVASEAPNALQLEIQEAIYRLRVKKLVCSALAGIDLAHNTTRH